MLRETERPESRFDTGCEKNKGRIERRWTEVYHIPPTTLGNDWQLLKSLIVVKRERDVKQKHSENWVKSSETSFYVSTYKQTAEHFNQVIRNHWGVENRNNYVRDVILNEDRCQIKSGIKGWATLRSFALNILHRNRAPSIKRELYKNAINLHRLRAYLYLF